MGTQPSSETLRASLSAASLTLHGAAYGAARETSLTGLAALRHFDDVFREAPAVENREIEDAFKLRYQVYCLDRGFENAAACPEGMERDRYDDQALHCLLRDRASARPLGTVRLVRPAAKPIWFADLPLTDYATQESLEHIVQLPAGSTAEVSRFAIARAAREILQAPGAVTARQIDRAAGQGTLGERLLPYMSLGLIRGLVRLSMQHGITHWCLAAEPSLLRRLRGFGLHFRTAGPLVEHRGLRQICYADLAELLSRAHAERPEFWDIITVGGFLLSGDLARAAA